MRCVQVQHADELHTRLREAALEGTAREAEHADAMRALRAATDEATEAAAAAAATSAAGGTSESTSGDGSGVGGDGDRSLRTMEVEEAEWQRRAESEAVGAARP